MDYFSPALSQAAYHMKARPPVPSFRGTFHRNPGHRQQQRFCGGFGGSARQSREAAALHVACLVLGPCLKRAGGRCTASCPTDLSLSTRHRQNARFRVYFLLRHTVLT